MASKRAWVVADEPNKVAELGRRLGGDLEVVDATNGHRSGERPDLILIDATADAAAQWASVTGVATLAVASGDPRTVLDAVARTASSFVISLGGGDADAALRLGCAKLARQQPFGLDQHLGGQLRTEIVTSAAQRDRVVDRVMASATEAGLRKQVVRRIGLVCDELLTNAIYNAPRGPNGVAKYAHVDRRDKIELLATEYVTVRFGAADGRFGLSVRDGFGALRRERVVSRLRACASSATPEAKQGGAGLGLFMVLGACHELAIQVAPGRAAEICAIWQASGNPPSGLLSFLETTPDLAAEELAAAPVEAMATPGGSFDDATQPDAWVHFGFGDTPRRRSRTPLGSIPPAVTGSAAGWASGRIALAGVRLLRRVEPLALERAIERIHGAEQASDILEAALELLVAEFSAAVLMCRDGGGLTVVCGAGDIDDWDAAQGPLASADNTLGRLLRRGGASFGRLPLGSLEAELAASLVGHEPAEGLGVALGGGASSDYVLFACRPIGGEADRASWDAVRRAANQALARLASAVPRREASGLLTDRMFAL